MTALLAATPLLLGAQMLLLPAYLGLLLGETERDPIQIEPFVHTFIWLIAIPLLLTDLVQASARRGSTGARVVEVLGLTPVPATALVLFLVVCSVVPQLDAARTSAMQAVPIYVASAALASLVGLAIRWLLRLTATGSRAVAFSAATRNSLVILLRGLAVPGAIEFLSELVYVRFMPKAGKDLEAQRA